MFIRQSFPRICLAIQAMVALLTAAGCVTSGRRGNLPTKWAMDDDRYAEQYGVPYSTDPGERRVQMRQEMIDASFQEGTSGIYIGGGSSTGHWGAAVGEIGRFWMPTSTTTVRVGAFGMDNGGTGIGGGEVGARLHAPTRLTPYVGLSSMLGLTGFHSGIATHNSRYARQGQTITKATGLFAIVPEVGLSYWVTPSSRLNMGASYYVTDGAKPDFLLFGMSMEFALGEIATPASEPYLGEESYSPITDTSERYFRDASEHFESPDLVPDMADTESIDDSGNRVTVFCPWPELEQRLPDSDSNLPPLLEYSPLFMPDSRQ